MAFDKDEAALRVSGDERRVTMLNPSPRSPNMASIARSEMMARKARLEREQDECRNDILSVVEAIGKGGADREIVRRAYDRAQSCGLEKTARALEGYLHSTATPEQVLGRTIIASSVIGVLAASLVVASKVK